MEASRGSFGKLEETWVAVLTKAKAIIKEELEETVNEDMNRMFREKTELLDARSLDLEFREKEFMKMKERTEMLDSDLKKRTKDLEDDKEKFNAWSNQQKERIRKEAEALEAKARELEERSQHLSAQETELEDAKKALDLKRQRDEDLDRKLETWQQRLKKREQELVRKETQFKQEMKKNQDSIEAEKNDLRMGWNNMKQNMAEREKRLADIDTQLKDIEDDLKKRKAHVEEMEGEQRKRSIDEEMVVSLSACGWMETEEFFSNLNGSAHVNVDTLESLKGLVRLIPEQRNAQLLIRVDRPGTRVTLVVKKVGLNGEEYVKTTIEGTGEGELNVALKNLHNAVLGKMHMGSQKGGKQSSSAMSENSHR